MLSKILAIEPKKFDTENAGAKHFKAPNKDSNTLLVRFEEFLKEDPHKDDFAPLMACLFGSDPVNASNLLLLCMSSEGISAFEWSELIRLRNEIRNDEGEWFKKAAELYHQIDVAIKNWIAASKEIAKIQVKIKAMRDIPDSEERGELEVRLYG